MNKDLKFLASILDNSSWSDDTTSVRLDIGGEVCFMGETSRYDFYPDDLDAAKEAFVPAPFQKRVGEEYSLQDILDAREELGLDSEKVWRGPEDGLPPVGTECEARIVDEWHEGEIVAHARGYAILMTEHDDTFALNKSSDFRPLRSEEDKVIQEMLCIMEGGAGERAARALYRAGYRQQVDDAVGFTLGPVSDGGIAPHDRQPTEHQPDVAGLVEALERIAMWPDGGNKYGQANIKVFASEALAAHRRRQCG